MTQERSAWSDAKQAFGRRVLKPCIFWTAGSCKRMKTANRAPSGRLYSQQQLVALHFHLLKMATMADAGDCNAFAAYSPEVYRHGNYMTSIKLDAADFSHPSGAAYVRVTGTLFTQVRPFTPVN